MWIDKLNAVLQCPVLPMKVYNGLLNWRDAFVRSVLENRIKAEIESSIAVSVSATECNGRKHIFLTLSKEFLSLSMLLIEKDYLMGQRQLRRAEDPEERGRVQGTREQILPSPTLLKASLFILSTLMAVLEEDWERVDVLAAESAGELLQISPDGRVLCFTYVAICLWMALNLLLE